jgi:magnesium-transporting ATPase (P-type)
MDSFAEEGLRTLLFAKKEFSKDSDVLKMEILELENDLELLGASGLEDEL